ncbi:DUF3592 domain-containing protein [Photobacterium chitinilyticum]|uniref:DUF3592 domain-containing protein n=1 Tax=Photobacterium chitinilyticum TaxID=2485123 RepID=A0A444JWY7_9GAMM|nr:hypothetical protein [Photobacterium chitinilyticum]RWX57589.1 hypothetical protein EDI28_06125 [Photobacterium chitinilyticum]
MSFYLEYFGSSFGKTYTIALVVLNLCFFIWNCRKIWGAFSDEFSVDGIITWSEYGWFANNGNFRKEGSITYRYVVDGKSYDGEYSIPYKIRRYGDGGKSVVEKYPKGSSIRVYYSIKNPGNHETEELTCFLDKAIHELFFVVPFWIAVFTAPAMFFYYLATFSY